MGGPPRHTSCLVAESPGFTGLGAPSLPGFPVSPLPGQCINLQPWLRALTRRVVPLMRGRPGCRRGRARATGLSPVGPPWAGAEAALPRGWGVAQCAATALAGAVPRLCVRGAGGRFGGLGPVPGVVSLLFPPSRPACPALRVASRPVRVSLTLARWYAIPRGLCVPRARSGCPSGSPRVPFAFVCARAPAASAPPPPGCSGVRTSRGPGTGRRWGPGHWALAPSGVLGGGGGPVPVPPYLAWPARPVGAACRGCGGGRSPGGGGWPATVVRAVWCQALSFPRPPVLWGGQPGYCDPCVPGGGRCGRGDPAPVPERAPLRAGIARCGGGGRVSPGGGAFHCCEGRLRSGAPPPPKLPTHWAGCWGPSPTCCGRGRVGVGAHHCPF